jgi:hypothetical protein
MKIKLNIYILITIILFLNGCPSTEPQIIRDGSSKEKAIIVTLIDDEYSYIKTLSCGGVGYYTVVKQTLIKIDNKMIDVLTVKCSANDEISNFYFDVTNLFKEK